MTKPKVLLISPGIIRWADMDFGLPHLVALGSYLQRDLDVRVEILDLNYEGGSHQTLAQRLEELGPFVLIGLSAYSSFDYMRVMTLARFIKRLHPKTPLVCGGYHASALPQDMIFDGSPFDAVLQGEGERPLKTIVETILGGGKLEKKIWPQDLIMDLDSLPHYDWRLLNRYWPHAQDIGRKFQIYLSRGCSYHCTFCMERAKSGYAWRAFSPERAIDELLRLRKFTDLSHWVVNIADPLFGFKRKWRKQVLQGIIDNDILPRQYWTLTRSDDLDEEDISLFSRAHFSIGIGLESGSHSMLRRMQKGNHPARYLEAALRLARLSQKHGLNWATNVIVGHPGEDLQSLQDTLTFLKQLFNVAKETCGWLSIDPFRLYPGSDIHQSMNKWEKQTGAVFHHKEWWKRWYNGPFCAQHLDPSHSLNYEQRVNFMFKHYAPLVADIQQKFRGQGRSIDRVFKRSLTEQCQQLSAASHKKLLHLAKQVPKGQHPSQALSTPIGLHLKNPWTRKREQAITRLLDQGILRSNHLVEALLEVAPEQFLAPNDAEALLQNKPISSIQPGLPATALPLTIMAMGLEALEPSEGDRIADLGAVSGYLTAILSRLVGDSGHVLALHPCRLHHIIARQLQSCRNVEVRRYSPFQPWDIIEDGPFDGLWLGAALPRAPRLFKQLLRDPEGRAITFLGPRFRPQDLVALTHRNKKLEERIICRYMAEPFTGTGGWKNRSTVQVNEQIQYQSTTSAPAFFHVLAHVDLGQDAANIYNDNLPPTAWSANLSRAYQQAAGRLHIHILPLLYPKLENLHLFLQNPTAPLADPAGKNLCKALKIALDSIETPIAMPKDEASSILKSIEEPLQSLRHFLWTQQKKSPPTLRIIDANALGKHARATTFNGERLVATSLETPTDHLLMQLLHEEIHPLTDPLVMQNWSQNERDSRAGSAGFYIHQELENTAIAATQALLTKLRPDLLSSFEKWYATYTITS